MEKWILSFLAFGILCGLCFTPGWICEDEVTLFSCKTKAKKGFWKPEIAKSIFPLFRESRFFWSRWTVSKSRPILNKNTIFLFSEKRFSYFCVFRKVRKICAHLKNVEKKAEKSYFFLSFSLFFSCILRWADEIQKNSFPRKQKNTKSYFKIGLLLGGPHLWNSLRL